MSMRIKVKIFISTETIEQDLKYPLQKKVSFAYDPKDKAVRVDRITLNDIESKNIFYNTSFAIANSDTVLTSVHEITKKGVYTLYLDDLYILSHRSNNWHCSTHKEDFIFNYEFTNDSFTNDYRDRDHKYFDDYFVPCFGCSFTFGAFQPADAAWPHLLRRKTGTNYINLGLGGSGIDGIYNNLKLLHKKKQFDRCVILFPNFERRIVRCKLDDLYLGMYSTIDVTAETSDFHFYNDSRLADKMKQVRESIFKDKDNRYSKIFLHKIISYCQDQKIDLAVSSWVTDVYDYLKQQKNVKILPKFPELSSYNERADDGEHPHRKHYQQFVEDIVSFL